MYLGVTGFIEDYSELLGFDFMAVWRWAEKAQLV